jgi:hypothetical protein
MKLFLALLLLSALPTVGFGQSTHSFIQPKREMAIPELGVPAPIHPGPIVITAPPEFPIEALYPPKKANIAKRAWKSIPERDRDLLPGYGVLGVGAFLDLYSTHEVIRLGNGQIVEGNVILVHADQIAEKLQLPTGTGRDIVSGAATVGFAVVVRNYIYPRSPRWAKIALFVAGAFRVSLFFWNKNNLKIIRP